MMNDNNFTSHFSVMTILVCTPHHDDSSFSHQHQYQQHLHISFLSHGHPSLNTLSWWLLLLQSTSISSYTRHVNSCQIRLGPQVTREIQHILHLGPEIQHLQDMNYSHSCIHARPVCSNHNRPEAITSTIGRHLPWDGSTKHEEAEFNDKRLAWWVRTDNITNQTHPMTHQQEYDMNS